MGGAGVYLLYLDESGNPDDPSDRHFILGGAAIYERSTYFVSTALDDLKKRHFPSHPPIEFHATDIRAGKGFWRRIAREKREELVHDIGRAIVESAQSPGLVLFAAVVQKDAVNHGEQSPFWKCRTMPVSGTGRLHTGDDHGQTSPTLGEPIAPLARVLRFSHYRPKRAPEESVGRELGREWGEPGSVSLGSVETHGVSGESKRRIRSR